MMKFVNRTPHAIKIVNQSEEIVLELPKCELPARVGMKITQVAVVHSVPLFASLLGDVYDLPAADTGTICIVSRMVADALPERTDLAVPGEALRNGDGVIIGAKGLFMHKDWILE